MATYQEDMRAVLFNVGISGETTNTEKLLTAIVVELSNIFKELKELRDKLESNTQQ